MLAAQGSSTVRAVSRLTVFLEGINTVTGEVELGIDIRDVSLKNMHDLKSAVFTFL